MRVCVKAHTADPAAVKSSHFKRCETTYSKLNDFCQQFDLETIKDLYLEKYDVSLKDALRDECSGDFKRLLLAICH